jgi:hypothetical protein
MDDSTLGTFGAPGPRCYTPDVIVSDKDRQGWVSEWTKKWKRKEGVIIGGRRGKTNSLRTQSVKKLQVTANLQSQSQEWRKKNMAVERMNRRRLSCKKHVECSLLSSQ